MNVDWSGFVLIRAFVWLMLWYILRKRGFMTGIDLSGFKGAVVPVKESDTAPVVQTRDVDGVEIIYCIFDSVNYYGEGDEKEGVTATNLLIANPDQTSPVKAVRLMVDTLGGNSTAIAVEVIGVVADIKVFHEGVSWPYESRNGLYNAETLVSICSKLPPCARVSDVLALMDKNINSSNSRVSVFSQRTGLENLMLLHQGIRPQHGVTDIPHQLAEQFTVFTDHGVFSQNEGVNRAMVSVLAENVMEVLNRNASPRLGSDPAPLGQHDDF